ncbi:unnamed protein product, partial [Owenia fusiformis]
LDSKINGLVWVLYNLFHFFSDKSETFNNYTNIAVNKPTYQFGPGLSGKAVDGNTDGSWYGGSCFAAVGNTNERPWWIVDLGKSYKVHRIVIWNRLDCCGDRLHDFAIDIGCEFDGVNADSPSWSRAYFHSGTPGSNPTTISFPQPPVGRFIKITNAVENNSADPSDDTLTMCELQVYAGNADCQCENGI